MMSNSDLELQQAIYTRLITPSLGWPVFDYVKPDSVMPYIEIGDSASKYADTKTSRMQEHDLSIHAWCNNRGFRLIKEMTSAIYERLHDAEQQITMPNHHLVIIQCEGTDYVSEEDEETHHGVVTFRVVTQEK